MINYLFIIFTLFASFGAAQNNGIFYGGYGSGHDAHCYSSVINNDIFVGLYGDGSSQTCLIPEMNNGIFTGFNGDGSAAACVQQYVNNSIFAGMNGDGNTSACIQQEINNLIFSGLYGDGTDGLCFTSAVNNNIFSASNGDGSDQSCYRVDLNSEIFAGGKGDGFDNSKINFLLWEGTINSEWNLVGNWNINRIPIYSDHVSIEDGKLNYPILAEKTFRINSIGIAQYICGSIFISSNSSLDSGVNTFIVNIGEIEIDGIWRVKNTLHASFINAEGGKIIIKTGGTLMFF